MSTMITPVPCLQHVPGTNHYLIVLDNDSSTAIGSSDSPEKAWKSACENLHRQLATEKSGYEAQRLTRWLHEHPDDDTLSLDCNRKRFCVVSA